MRAIFLIKCVLLLVFQFGYSQEAGIQNGKVDDNFIGGFQDFNINQKPLYIVKNEPKADYYVKTITDLKKALATAKPQQSVYLDGDSSFNLTYLAPLSIPEGVILYSDRGKNGKRGALIYANKYETNPLFKTTGNNVKISGLRIKGPDGEVINKPEVDKIVNRAKQSGKNINLTSIQTYGIPNSKGILISHKNVEIENCEIYNWSHAAIFVDNAGSAEIHHNYIHHNQRKGLGYGVMVEGFANITANIFDYNRHAIAGSGVPGSGYSAEFNIALQNSSDQGHIFDMHGGKDRKDGTNIAGKSVSIKNNLFYLKSNRAAVKVRGVSQSQSRIENNVIILSDQIQGDSYDIKKDLYNAKIKKGASNLLARIFSTAKIDKETPPVDDLIVQVFGQGNLVTQNNIVFKK